MAYVDACTNSILVLFSVLFEHVQTKMKKCLMITFVKQQSHHPHMRVCDHISVSSSMEPLYYQATRNVQKWK